MIHKKEDKEMKSDESVKTVEKRMKNLRMQRNKKKVV